MAITFAVRGDSLDARYSSAGKTPAIYGSNDPAEVNTDQAGINGTSSIDMAGSFLTFRALSYIGRENTPSGRPRSVLMRAKIASAGGNVALFGVGHLNRNPINFMGAYLDTSGDVNVTVSNESAQTDTSKTTAGTITNIATDAGSAVWHDIVVTWDGTTGTNALEIWIDGTREIQDTMTRDLPTYNANQQLACASINIGTEFVQTNTHLFLDEFVIWDEVITPTSVGLTSGSGSLNGNSRSAYVDVASFDGLSSAGGVANLGSFG